MRKIQIERKLFELFGHQFLVFENFEDMDLNIDDQSIYKNDDPQALVDIFVKNQFYSIWNDKRRLNAAIICSCDGNLNLVVDFLMKIGIQSDNYATFDCGLKRGDRVLYFTNHKDMRQFIQHLTSALNAKKLIGNDFFKQKTRQKKNKNDQILLD